MGYKASIIIPCYNKKKYLKRALNSVVALSRFSDFEVIVVDDGSTDGSDLIATEYAEKYHNVTLHRFETGSGSPSRPRNYGIDNSQTDYLIFMDPDDIIINDGYSILLSKMEEYKSDVLIAARNGVDSLGNLIFIDYIDRRFTFINQNDARIQLDLLNRRPFILKTIYSKKLLLENNIRFNEVISTSEDEAFDMQCVAYAKTITKINDVVYQYTVEAQGSLTTKPSMKIYNDLLDVMEELERTYKLLFSDEITYERIAALVDVFYVNRIAFMDNLDNIEQASELVCSVFEQFGLQKFDCLVNRRRIDFIEAVKQKNIAHYVQLYMLKRIKTLSSKLRTEQKEHRLEIKNYRKELASVRHLLQRKAVKPAVAFARQLDKITRKGSKANDPQKGKPKEVSKKEASLKHFYNNIDNAPNDYWVFMDRPDAARDNAETLYRYVMCKGIHDKLAFVLDAKSKDYQRLIDDGFNVLPYNSFDHWQLLKSASFFFTAHCDGYLLEPWYYETPQKKLESASNYPVESLYKLIFLQHGVIRSNLSGWLGGKPFYKFVTSAYPEAHSLLSIPHYGLIDEDIARTGLARWDNLKQVEADKITIFPTWRKNITFANEEKQSQRILSSSFLRNWVEFCNSDSMLSLAKEHPVRFIAHHDNMIMVERLREYISDQIEVISYAEAGAFSDIVNESILMMTDYSSFSFDFLYLDKPVIYFDFDKNALTQNVRGVEYARFGDYCTTMSEAEEALRNIAHQSFAASDKHKDELNRFFFERDGLHCEHIIHEVCHRL